MIFKVAEGSSTLPNIREGSIYRSHWTLQTDAVQKLSPRLNFQIQMPDNQMTASKKCVIQR